MIKLNQTEKTQTYKVKCQHCNYENIFYHLNWDTAFIYLLSTCFVCKKSIGEKEVLKQLGKYQ
tara:strand:- start:235 stop:423 length:189 start_codon:yes stop_codon:yes gene_type:complete